MEFKTFHKSSLKTLIESEVFQSWNNIPISFHRAISHIANPRALEKDVLLIIVTDDEQLIGYLGLLPDDLIFNTQKQHVAWLSCLWLDAAYRGKQIVQQMLKIANKNWGENMLISGVVPQIEKIYSKSGYFNHIFELKGLKIYAGFDFSTWLPPKHAIFRKTQGLLKVADNFFNLFCFVKTQDIQSNINCNKAIFNDALQQFLAKTASPYLAQKSFIDWQWMLTYPWVLEKGKPEPRYYFTSVADQFQYLSYQFANKEDEIVGFVIFNIRDKTLKMPALYGFEQIENELLVLIKQIIKQYNIASFVTFQDGLINAIQNGKLSGYYKKEQSRKIFIGNSINFNALSQDLFQDGDGDLGFT